jgi:hypothetical protein
MKKIQLFSIIGLTLLASCKKDDVNFDGPSLIDLYGEFSILSPLEVSDNSLDFAAGETATFTAEFSKSVDWTVRITGLESGAVKNIIGFSRLLDVSNAVWNGSTTTLPMFKAEECAVALYVTGETDTLRDTITVISPKVNNGLLLADFEDGWNAGWGSFVQSGADMSFVIREDGNAAQGNKYYDMGGEVSWDWLIGLIDIPATAYGAPTFDLSNNPDNVFFNILMAKQPGLTNALVLFQFREDDNGDGVYTDNEEDLFSIEVRLDSQDGWQLISSKYADLATLINGSPADPIGNGIHEPEKLLQVSILMLANPVSGYSQAWMDYILFTENGPLVP